jgi:hypothetical protein
MQSWVESLYFLYNFLRSKTQIPQFLYLTSSIYRKLTLTHYKNLLHFIRNSISQSGRRRTKLFQSDGKLTFFHHLGCLVLRQFSRFLTVYLDFLPQGCMMWSFESWPRVVMDLSAT